MSGGSNLYSQGFGTTSSNTFPSSPIISTRVPTTSDTSGSQGPLPLGKVWINKTTPASYQLLELTTSNGVVSATWVLQAVNSGDIETIGSDSGTATPVSNNVDIVGSGDISTAASGDTLTIAFTAGTTAIDTVNGDSGSAAPVGGEISVVGTSNQLSSSGAAATLTFSLDAELESGSLTARGGTRHTSTLGTGAGANPAVFDTSFVGYNCGANNTAAGSTAMGSVALTANTSGTGNTAMGFTALAAVTTSVDSTAVGWNALPVATGGSNTALGSGTAFSLTSGESHVVVGANALTTNITGDECVAIGTNALGLATISHLTAIGHDALTLCSTGVENTAVGWSSLSTITTGNSCTAVGWSSLLAATGVGNSGIGSQSGLAISTGDNNTTVGYVSLSSNTTGDNNTCIGMQAMQTATSPSDCVIVGKSAGSAYIGAESDNILIGSAVTGTVSTSNELIIGTGTGTGTGQINTAFVSGIRGITTANADAIAVLVDSVGQLGTVSSSLRFKEQIESLGNSERIYDLRPVSFKYKSQSSDRPQFGLIAEEVNDVIPEIVVRDREGEIETIQYQTLPIFLLAEIQKLRKEIDELKAGK